ncbi:MAG TPA: hypothetical protein VGC76_00145 [Pyrinomonadaceae bacterium]
MNFQSKFIKTALVSFVFILLSFTVSKAQDSEFSFKVTNNTKTAIKKLLVAEPGQKKWGYFDIGAGIGAGKTVTLVWNKSTDKEQCVQWFKAVYADGSESEPAKFDFCEDELELEFN